MKKTTVFLLAIIFLLVSIYSCNDSNSADIDDTDILIDTSDDSNSDSDLYDSGKFNNIIVEENEYTLYLYDDPNYDPSDLHTTTKPIFPAAALTTTTQDQPVSPTLVREGDTFLGWKAAKIDARYIYHDDGRMYPAYYDGVIAQFEGEVTVKAKITYYKDNFSGESLMIVPTDEYQKFFPILYNENKGYITSFSAYNTDEVLDMLEHKYGEYECEITVKDYHLIRVPLERVCMATVADMTVLSVIENYNYVINEPLQIDDIQLEFMEDSLSGGQYTQFMLTAQNNEVYFDGICSSGRTDTRDILHLADLTGDGMPEVIVIFTTGSGTGVNQQEVHIFDGVTLKEHNIRSIEDIIQNEVSVSADDENFYVKTAETEVTIEKSSLESTGKWLFITPNMSMIYTYEVFANNLYGIVPIQVGITEFSGNIEVAYEFDSDGFNPRKISIYQGKETSSLEINS